MGESAYAIRNRKATKLWYDCFVGRCLYMGKGQKRNGKKSLVEVVGMWMHFLHFNSNWSHITLRSSLCSTSVKGKLFLILTS